jgi:hypothetical protein
MIERDPGSIRIELAETDAEPPHNEAILEFK